MGPAAHTLCCVVMRRAHVSGLLVLSLCLLLVVSTERTTPAFAQAACFAETGFCIDEAAFQRYYESRGGARILGFPVSRTFRLEGFPVQFYQRVVLQLQDGNVARLNLLDPGVLPVTRANQSVFPAPDASLASDAPRPEDPAYAQRVVEYVRAVAPDTWNGRPVGFAGLFNSTVPAQGASPEIATLLNLEIWGLPTSAPTFDPGNQGFVYQRFQRGIMHFRTDCGCTEGILVGDYLKSVLTGRDVPPDLASEMQSSRYFGQYAPGASGWLARPGELPGYGLDRGVRTGHRHSGGDRSHGYARARGADGDASAWSPRLRPSRRLPSPVPCGRRQRACASRCSIYRSKLPLTTAARTAWLVCRWASTSCTPSISKVA